MGESDGIINSALTFLELRELFNEFNIEEKQLEFSDFDPPFGFTGDLFPIANGILQAAGLDEGLLTGNITTVEGEREMKASLRQFQDEGDIINSHFNIFYTEFLMGPGTSKKGKKYIRRARVKSYAKKRLKKFDHDVWENELREYSLLDFSRKFKNDDQRLYPSEEKVQKILDELRQDGRDDMGCGACGYGSCREFAVAIAKGLATPEMCNHYTNRNRQNYIHSLKVSNDKLAQAEKAKRKIENKIKRPVEIIPEWDSFKVIIPGFYTREETYPYYPELAGMGFTDIFVYEKPLIDRR